MADETKLTAATRIEKLLDNIAGGDNEVTPATRLEKFLSYIADAMEGGGGSGGGGDSGECEDCVKILSGEQVNTSEHPDATIYGYIESDGWFDISVINPVSMLINTQDDIPGAYVINDPVLGVTFPQYIAPISDLVTGETHVPDPAAGNSRGYYIEYADAYSVFGNTEFSILVLKNGVVNYFEGLG